MEEIQVKFVASGGNQLSGILTKPLSSTGANENKVVVLVHGGMAHKNSFYHPSLAYSLATEEGFTVFRYDALSAGESRPICKEMCTGASKSVV
jgi:pimeloyl-ACP methyl ester carboxylesterase